MTLSEYIEGLKGKKIDVIGIGVSNIPLIKKLAESGCTVCARDKDVYKRQIQDCVPGKSCMRNFS